MANNYFYQQFHDISDEKFKRQQKFIKKMNARMKFKKPFRLNRHHHAMR